MIDYTRGLLTLEETSELLNLPSFRIGLAVLQAQIRCGVIARNWRGNCLPSRDDIPRGPNGHIWTSRGIQEIHDRDRKDWSWRITLEGTDVSYLIRSAWAGHFWYLHHTDAYRLFAEEKGGIDAEILEPLDGAFLHAHQPDRYPVSEFLFFVDREQPNRRITTADLLFLQSDIEAFHSACGSALARPFGDTERNTLLKIILGMAMDTYGFNPGAARNAATGDNKGSIAAALERQRLSVDSDTIRKYLTEAAERHQPENPHKR